MSKIAKNFKFNSHVTWKSVVTFAFAVITGSYFNGNNFSKGVESVYLFWVYQIVIVIGSAFFTLISNNSNAVTNIINTLSDMRKIFLSTTMTPDAKLKALEMDAHLIELYLTSMVQVWDKITNEINTIINSGGK